MSRALSFFALIFVPVFSAPEIAAPGKPLPHPGAVWIVPQLGLSMYHLEPGEFTMGSPATEPEREVNEAPHRVILTDPFWLGQTEVTMRQWREIMSTDVKTQVLRALANDERYNLGGTMRTQRAAWELAKNSDPALRLGNVADDLPMVYVTWDEAMEFCHRLNARERAAQRLSDGYEYTLPTEAQWEYACRAGTTTATYAGPIHIVGRHNAPVLDRIAWYGGNCSVGYQGPGWELANWPDRQYPGPMGGYRVVGTKEGNAWGLHDMLGNVWEWCRDWSGDYPAGTVKNPTGPNSGEKRIIRGGSWFFRASYCRSAQRYGSEPGLRFHDLGFRLALSAIADR